MSSKGEVETGVEGEGMASLRPVTLEEELRRNPELREADVALLREWADKQPHLPHVLDRELAMCLHAAYYSLEIAKTKADFIFTERTHFPDLFRNRDPLSRELQLAMGVLGMVVLPKTTPEGYTVILLRLLDTDASHFVHADVVKCLIMFLELRVILHGAVPGFIFAVDIRRFSPSHLARHSLVIFRDFYFCVPDGMPFRLKGIHFINVVPLMDKLLLLMKPFMKKEIYEQIHVHEKGMESFYKFVPKDILPADYGGSAPSFLEMNEQRAALLVANREYFLAEEQRMTDESRRPKRDDDPWSLFGAEGSFKKLDLD